ncbi:hypothetical protein AC249_AIPGENE21392 [Exaiptasia diaphana]|nr:hypothetical protein AC249_AIPGENE21392 [Exaiptasia diaphana]
MAEEFVRKKALVALCILELVELSSEKKKKTAKEEEELVAELELEDVQGYNQYFRMDKSQFSYLGDLIDTLVRRSDTVMRKSIKTDERLAVTLRYLATGETFKSLEYQFRIGRKAISNIVLEVCEAITTVLSPEFLKVPKTRDEWLCIANKFESRWNFPHVIGAVDGKRVIIQQPGNSGSHFYDYKGNNSIILLAAVGPEYEILWADIGTNGRASDGTVWQKCDLKQALSSPHWIYQMPPLYLEE